MSEDIQSEVNAQSRGIITLSAVVTRADGTVEDLGVISTGVIDPIPEPDPSERT